MLTTTAPSLQSLDNPPQLTSKRQSRPSQFASSIQNFKQQYEKSCRKPRPPHSNSEDTGVDPLPHPKNAPCALRCVLPSGKKINLSIVIKKRGTRKIKKSGSCRKISERETPEAQPAEPQPVKPHLDLLSKFLLVAQELNKLEQEQKEKVVSEHAGSADKNEKAEGRREGRARGERDEQEKLGRVWERSCALTYRLETLLQQLSYL